jgi:two-component system, cell cycle response regulator DivK
MSDKHALIIDDNSKNVSVLARMLAAEQVKTTQLTHPKQLDSILAALGQVNVVFLDLEMPDMDGYQVLQQLKADPQFQGVPIVAYTVHLSEITVAHEHGFDGFIGKPLDSDQFPNQLARILNGEPVWETG